MVCLRNICVNALHKGDSDDDDDNNYYYLLRFNSIRVVSILRTANE
jgi:hypothetical protein